VIHQVQNNTDELDDALSDFAARHLAAMTLVARWPVERAALATRDYLDTLAAAAVDRALAELSLAATEGDDV
jgi:hypothetical protein